MPQTHWRSKSSWLSPRESGLQIVLNIRWNEYIFDLAWSRLGVETAELSEVAVDREVF